MIFSSVITGHFFEIITLFILVLIHEMGHVTAAWSFGWRMTTMELLPFGGVAKTEEWGTVPSREEMIVSLAGPVQHFFMILLSLFLHLEGLWSDAWTMYFIKANLLIAGFNLLPIYPLDGGRILHSWLSYLCPYLSCIQYTLWISTFLSTGLLIASFFIPGNTVHVPLFCIAIFLIISNILSLKKSSYQYLRFLIGRKDKGIREHATIKKIRVRLDEPLWGTLKRWYKEKYHVYKVVDKKGRVVGVVPEEIILEKFFRNQHPRCKVEEFIS
jgi:stage IV sporulation protein FB